MKAIVQDRFGGPEVLALRDVPMPVPGEGEVLVRVRAASVNARDWHLMRGDPYLSRLVSKEMGMRAPNVRIGTDFAGTVEAVGSGVTLRPGDEVFGEAYGAFAEYVAAPSTVVERKPANLGFAEAAALPLAANTALTCLRDGERLRSGQRLLINGASGGVGLFAVQIGKWLGAEVTGVCRTRNAELVNKAGADDVIDYTRTDFARLRRPFEVVFDLVGNRSLRDLRRVLTPNGTLILSGGGVSKGGSVIGPMALFFKAAALSRFVRHRIEIPLAAPSVANLATLRELAEAGTLTPFIDRSYPLTQAADAIRYVETEHARAKVVLTT